MINKIIKLQDVKKLTTLSSSSVYRLASKGRFPRPIKLSKRSSGWIEQEVLDYLDQCINQREAAHEETELVELEVNSC